MTLDVLILHDTQLGHVPPRCRKWTIALLLLISVIMLIAHHTYDHMCQIDDIHGV